MEFEIALKDRVGAFAANEMINSEAELKKFKDACKLGNYQFLVKICGKSKKFTFGDAMVTSCKFGNLKLFKALLNNINTVNYSDDEFQQCLNYACDGNFSELVKYILSSVNFEFDYHVINYKSLAVLQAIGKNANHRKAFLDSCSSGDKSFFKHCLTFISQIELSEQEHEELIKQAVYNVCSVDNYRFVKYVLSKLECKTQQSFNAGLLSACENGLPVIVELMLFRYRPTNINECTDAIRCNLYDDQYIEIYNLLQLVNTKGYDGYEYESGNDSEPESENESEPESENE